MDNNTTVTDKELEMINEAEESEHYSECCDAPIIMGLCVDCKEHAE